MVRGGGGGGGGEIVEVEGGHIVRSIGRKDRHSKVCTAKGPRDRRVRLSAHTAIQFYDVQDRLGYNRPSKAVEWLIKKAKSSIDQLAHLPPWKPTLQTPPNHAESHNPQILNHGGGASSYLPFDNMLHHNDHVLFAGTAFENLLALNNNNNSGCGGEGGGGGFVFNAPSAFPDSVIPSSPVVFGHDFFTQRGPLQSSNSPSVRAWIDTPSFVAAADDHCHHHYLSPAPALLYQSAPSTAAFPDAFSGFCMPARILGQEEHYDGGLFDKPSSASSDSRR